MDATPKQSPKLHYAPRPPVHKQRRFQRYLYLVAAIFVIGSSFYWGSNAWRRVQILYWQRQCMNYQPPPDQIVCEFIDGKQVKSVIPKAWQEFYSLHSPPGVKSNGTLFLHEMRSGHGEKRLVTVDLVGYTFLTWDPYLATSRRVFQPAALFRPEDEVSSSTGAIFSGLPPKTPHRLLVYAGQIDPNDPTHFTIEFDVDGKRGVIDGWLQKLDFGAEVNTDHVILELRENFSTTQPSPSSPAKSE